MGNNLGSKHWKYQRYSALVLTPITLWLLVRIIFRPELSYAEVKQWLSLPTSFLLLVLVISVLCFHAVIGIQVVLEDYVSNGRLQKQLVNLVRWCAVLITVCSVGAILFTWTQ